MVGQPAVGVEVQVLDNPRLTCCRTRCEIAVRGAASWPATGEAGGDGRGHARRLVTDRGLGYRDEDSYIYLVDRAEDMIVSAADIYSTEVEDALGTLPRSQEAACSASPTRAGARRSTRWYSPGSRWRRTCWPRTAASGSPD